MARKGVDRNKYAGTEEFQSYLNQQRTRSHLDDIYDFENTNLEREDVKVTRAGNRSFIKKTGYMDDDEFDTFVERSRESGAVRYDPGSKQNFTTDSSLDRAGVPDPLEITMERDIEARRQDARKEAPLTKDVDKWASDPSRYDFPILDTPDSFQDNLPADDTVAALDRHPADKLEDLFY